MNNSVPLSSDSKSKPAAANKRAELRASHKAAGRRTLFFSLLIPLAFVLGLGSGYLLWGRSGAATAADGTTTAAGAADDTTAAAADQPIQRYDVPVDDDPAIGPDNAAITIIEFSDYECPYCQRWHAETFKQILRDFPDQVRIVYRDFPLGNHPNATPAAEAANCANEQGQFWAFHDMLFSGTVALGSEGYSQAAQSLGLDMTQFEQCVSERRFSAEVQADLEFAVNLGVNSTPTFFVNGMPVVGAQPYSVFKEVIEKELAGEYSQ